MAKPIKLMVGLGFAILVMVGLIFGGIIPLSIYSESTDTVLWSSHNIDGIGSFDTNSDGFKDEAMSAPRYIASWTPDENGETITAGGGIIWRGYDGVCKIQLQKARYEWFRLDAASDLIDSRSRDVTPSDWPKDLDSTTDKDNEISFTNDNWVIEGQEVGLVQFQVNIDYAYRKPGSLGGCLFPKDWQYSSGATLVRDNGHIYSGIGKVWIKSEQPVEVGEDIVIGYDVGYASSGGSGGWTLQLKKPADQGGTAVKTWNPSDDTTSQVSYPVTAAMFTEGSSNQWQVFLKNTLINQADTIVVTIDFRELAPGQPSLSFTHSGTESRPRAGDTITLTYHSEPNPTTGYEIVHYTIRLSESGDILEYITGAEIYDFVVGGNDNIRVTVIAFDGHRSSAPVEVNVEIDPNIEDDPYDGGDVDDNPKILLLYILIAAIIAFLLLIVWALVPLPPIFKIGISLGIIAAVIAIVLAFL